MKKELITEKWLLSRGYSKVYEGKLLCYTNGREHYEYNDYDGTYTFVDNRNRVYGMKYLNDILNLTDIINRK